MTFERDCSENTSLFRLRVAAEADPSALPRMLGYFQNLNVTPRQIVVEFATTGLLHVQIDIAGVPERHLSLLAAKIAQSVPVINAYWHWL